MERFDLSRTLIDITVSRVLYEMDSDMNRNVRKLLDAALSVSSGRFQKRFFESAQRIMANEDSAYYEMLHNLIGFADHNKLKTFGINLGYNGCTAGAKQIRQNEAAWHFDIPWNIFVDIGKGCAAPADVDRLIRQGKALGIYVYTVISDHALNSAYHDIFKAHEDCAFLLLTDPDEVLETVLDGYADLPNCLFMVDSDRENIQAAVDELKAEHFLFGIYRKYAMDNLDDLLSDDALAQCAAYGGAFVLLCPIPTCSLKEAEAIEARLVHIRDEQRYPFLLMDAQADNLRIDRIISDSPCSVAFDATGQIHTAGTVWTGAEYNYLHTDLKTILQKTNVKNAAGADPSGLAQ